MHFRLGETVVVKTQIRNDVGNLVDPATSVKISIFDLHNGAEVDCADMVKFAVGLYRYYYTIPQDATTGDFRVVVEDVDGVVVTYDDNETFNVTLV